MRFLLVSTLVAGDAVAKETNLHMQCKAANSDTFLIMSIGSSALTNAPRPTLIQALIRLCGSSTLANGSFFPFYSLLSSFSEPVCSMRLDHSIRSQQALCWQHAGGEDKGQWSIR